MLNQNFILGFGERLSEPTTLPGRKIEKKPVYDYSESLEFLTQDIGAIVTTVNAMPVLSLPKNIAVVSFVLHPEFMAMSYYPQTIFNELSVDIVGSKLIQIVPRRFSTEREMIPTFTIEYFVACNKNKLEAWPEIFNTFSANNKLRDELTRFEKFSSIRPIDKIKGGTLSTHNNKYEVVIHTDIQQEEIDINLSYNSYATTLGVIPDLRRSISTNGLVFIPTVSRPEQIEQLANFSLIRAIRPMPRLRPHPIRQNIDDNANLFSIQLPTGVPIDPGLVGAIFDGGIRAKSPLITWTNPYETEGCLQTNPNYLEHGEKVTSSALFGHIQEDEEIPRPFGYIDHYRVLDNNIDQDEDLFDVLIRIRDILQSNIYEFVNLSIGPELPIEDDEVHVWTSVIDEILSNGNTLCTIAVGNGGELDPILRFNRIQVPSDSVNGLSVGSIDSTDDNWLRASYSSIGPGRSPGLIKPDVVAFGGSEDMPFNTINGDTLMNSPSVGTSFASPSVMRLGMGVRAHFGNLISILAIKTLLINCSTPNRENRHEIGWGKVPNNIEKLVICSPGSVRILYQGEILPGTVIRAKIPLPEEQISGNVNIKATLCYVSDTESNHIGNYTKAGIGVIFRPHEDKFREDSTVAITDSFFSAGNYSGELELRMDSLKWETTMHSEKTKRGASLKGPVFDIHYMARESGRNARLFAPKLRYAMVIAVTVKNDNNIYNKITSRYRTQIRPLTPVINIPIKT
ncbi:MAG: S8 family peptidase [Candidatus Neomarinimicrobiota bacterium]